MDVMPELLTSVLISKPESTENNKKQKNKHYKKQRAIDNVTESDDVILDETQETQVEKASAWAEKDRRSTRDRRQQVVQRGRWLESRNTKDRRRSDKGISITI